MLLWSYFIVVLKILAFPFSLVLEVPTPLKVHLLVHCVV